MRNEKSFHCIVVSCMCRLKMVDIYSDTVSELHKKEIINLRFPFKLWLLINVPNSILNWSREGSAILLDYIELNQYLSSNASIFKSRTVSQFLQQLAIHMFERVTSDEQLLKDGKIEYHHTNFIQNRFELVHLIQQQKQSPNSSKNNLQIATAVKSRHPCADPCLQKFCPVSAIERARLHLRILIQVHNETFMLDRKLSECDPKKPLGQMSVIELPADAFENPADSVSHFEENPEYAGYYGNATTEKIKNFFEEYLPIYALENGEGEKEPQLSNMNRPEEATTSSSNSTCALSIASNQQHPFAELPAIIPDFKIEYPVDLTATINDNKSCNFKIVEEASGSLIASSVAGIDQVADVYPKSGKDSDSCLHDVDICMDEYLKFKDTSKECVDKNDVGPTPVTDIDMKIEIKEEDTAASAESVEKMELEDDTNKGVTDDEMRENTFKSFLHQFRESINLLYD